MAKIFRLGGIIRLITLSLVMTLCLGFNARAAEKKESETGYILEHIKDSHSWHLFDIDGEAVAVPLPVILYSSEAGLTVFSSGAFHHDHSGEHGVTRGAYTYYNLHEKIYQVPAGEELHVSEDGHAEAAIPFDLSITKNVFFMLISALILMGIFVSVGNRYKKTGNVAPKGLQSWMEPVILFVRDEIAIPNIGEKKYRKFMPYLLTIFFFIWINNMLGLLPGAANVTGNIAITFTLAIITFLITNFSGNKAYWKHIFDTPGVPWWLKYGIPIMPIVEVIGIFTKPFSLMVRLFANITAGHIIILSIIGLIFIFKSLGVSAVSIPFATAMNFLELLVAFIQAYVFTMLSAIYIGQAVEDHH